MTDSILDGSGAFGAEHDEGGARPSIEGVWADMEGRLRPFVARRVAEADIDDVVQEVFLRIQRGIGGVSEEERLASWLFTVTRNVIHDHHRRALRRSANEVDGDLDGDIEIAALEEDAADVYAAAASCASKFVATLPSPYREALELTELGGLSQREASARLGVSYSAMKSRVQRGREQLRDLVAACCDIELDARHRVVGCASVVPCGSSGCTRPEKL